MAEQVSVRCILWETLKFSYCIFQYSCQKHLPRACCLQEASCHPSKVATCIASLVLRLRSAPILQCQSHAFITLVACFKEYYGTIEDGWYEWSIGRFFCLIRFVNRLQCDCSWTAIEHDDAGGRTYHHVSKEWWGKKRKLPEPRPQFCHENSLRTAARFTL